MKFVLVLVILFVVMATTQGASIFGPPADHPFYTKKIYKKWPFQKNLHGLTKNEKYCFDQSGCPYYCVELKESKTDPSDPTKAEKCALKCNWDYIVDCSEQRPPV